MENAQQQEPEQRQQGALSLVGKVLRMLAIYWLITALGSHFLGMGARRGGGDGWSAETGGVSITGGSGGGGDGRRSLSDNMMPLFPRGQEMWFGCYLTSESQIESFESMEPIWEEQHVFVGTESGERSVELVLRESDAKLAPLYRSLINNGTVFLHMFFAKRGRPIDPTDAHYSPLAAFNMTRQLNEYRRIKRVELKNLLDSLSSASQNSSSTEANRDAPVAAEIGSYWNPNITVQIVDFFEPIKTSSMPPQFLDHVVPAARRPDAYYPIMYFNDFWTLKQNMLLLNDTVSEIPLRIDFSTLNMFKWQMYLQMEMSLQLQKSFGAMSDNDDDEFKRMLVETNPWLLALTVAVSIAHSVLEFLAFKNDISHWKQMKSLEGMSVNTLLINAAFQVVILLYLLDNDTSWLVLGSTFVGLLIELWKIKKAIVFSRKTTFPYFTWDDRETYTATKTKEYDDIAIRYVSYAMFPLLIAYAAYSVVYETHKSWYSFILNTAVGFIYMFGFIMMVPQLYVNYRLKSVAHLPLRALAYKAVNTFIDDLFSFIIKMPTLHRLACFRDDIIFFIYLYQRWIYPVDKTRMNEFGFTGEGDTSDGGASVESVGGVEQTTAATTAPASEHGDGQSTGTPIGSSAEEARSTMMRRRRE